MPFADAMCDSCHVAASGAAVAPKLKDGGLALCGDCHDFGAMQKRPRAHDPVKQGTCFACHTPHATSRQHLVKANVAELCGECHDSSDAEVAAKHRRVNADADCTSCHPPHEPGAVRTRKSKPPPGASPPARKKGAKGSRAR